LLDTSQNQKNSKKKKRRTAAEIQKEFEVETTFFNLKERYLNFINFL